MIRAVVTACVLLAMVATASGCLTEQQSLSTMPGLCFSVHKKLKKYAAAVDTCSTSGGNIMAVYDSQTQTAMEELLDFYPGIIEVHIGADKKGNGSYIIKANGDLLTWSNWAADEPDHQTGHDCLMASKAASWHWYVTTCQTLHSYICRHEVINGSSIVELTTTQSIPDQSISSASLSTAWSILSTDTEFSLLVSTQINNLPSLSSMEYVEIPSSLFAVVDSDYLTSSALSLEYDSSSADVATALSLSDREVYLEDSATSLTTLFTTYKAEFRTEFASSSGMEDTSTGMASTGTRTSNLEHYSSSERIASWAESTIYAEMTSMAAVSSAFMLEAAQNNLTSTRYLESSFTAPSVLLEDSSNLESTSLTRTTDELSQMSTYDLVADVMYSSDLAVSSTISPTSISSSKVRSNLCDNYSIISIDINITSPQELINPCCRQNPIIVGTATKISFLSQPTLRRKDTARFSTRTRSDNRTSAICIGTVGIVVLVVFFGGMLITDIASITKALQFHTFHKRSR